MDEIRQLGPLLDILQLAVTVILMLHLLSLLPQWRRQYFNPRCLRIMQYGLILAIGQGAVVATAIDSMPLPHPSALLYLGIALAMHAYIAVQNLLASYAFVHLYRPSAIVAQRLRASVRPFGLLSTALSIAACVGIGGWF